MKYRIIAVTAAVVLTATSFVPAYAADAIKVAVSHKTSWDAVPTMIAHEKGFFKEQNLDVTFIAAAGGSETVQTVSTGSVQIVANASVHAAIAAYAKGAEIRIFASQVTGSPDIFWYVKADSPIKKPQDLDGKNVTYSRPNSVTHMVIQNLAKERKFSPKLISGGALPAVRTMLMTGQADAAWSVAPFAADGIKAGEVRILFTGDDVLAAKSVVSRVSLVNAEFVKTHRDVVRRFQTATQKALDHIYGPEFDSVVQWFAKLNEQDVDAIRKVAPMFGSKQQRALTPIERFDEAVNQAVEFELIKEKLTPAQAKEIVDIVPPA
jgi:NitT/TauT family transport system substrate-binding protein